MGDVGAAQRAIGRATLLIMTFSLVSKVLALAKEMYVAALFGASASLDAFNIAFGFPAILALTLTSAFGAAFVPLYVEWNSLSPVKAEERFLSLFYTSALVFFALTLVFFFVAPWFYPWFGYGMEALTKRTVVVLGRELSGFFLIECLAILPAAYLQAKKKFLYLHASTIFPNIITIVCLFALRSWHIQALVWGVILGSLGRCGYLLVTVAKSTIKEKVSVKFQFDTWRTLLFLALPLLGSELIANVNIFVDQVMATELSAGAVSTLRYAYRVNDLPIQLMILALTSAILPYLSEMALERDRRGLGEMFFFLVTAVGILSFPMTGVLLLHAEDVIRLLFFRGAFDENAVAATALTLQCYSLGLFFYAYSFVNGTFFAALRNMKPLFYVGCASVVLNILFNKIGMRWLGVSGIALSTSGNLFVVTVVFVVLLKRRLRLLGMSRVVKNAFILGLSTALMVLMGFLLKKFHFEPFPKSHLVASLAVEGCVYCLGLYFLGTEDMKQIFNILSRSCRGILR